MLTKGITRFVETHRRDMEYTGMSVSASIITSEHRTVWITVGDFHSIGNTESRGFTLDTFEIGEERFEEGEQREKMHAYISGAMALIRCVAEKKRRMRTLNWKPRGQ